MFCNYGVDMNPNGCLSFMLLYLWYSCCVFNSDFDFEIALSFYNISVKIVCAHINDYIQGTFTNTHVSIYFIYQYK